MCEGESEAFVIGGRAVFEEALPRSERLYVTRVHAEVEGDVLFPEIDWGRWRCVAEERHAADARNDFPHTFFIYEASAAR
jgi:dihydrofolate reductase